MWKTKTIILRAPFVIWKVLDECRGDKDELDMLMAEWELCEEGVCELGKKLLEVLPKK